MSDPIQSLTGSPNDIASGINAAAVVNYAAVVDKCHVITGIAWSYIAAPEAGGIKVEDGAGNVIFELDITADGPNQIHFRPHKRGSSNVAMLITLLTGGVDVRGKINVLGHYTQG